tara:strand:- start:566 stop:763 length:198 start_codon:yes stop_codon:yes gene_type:complete
VVGRDEHEAALRNLLRREGRNRQKELCWHKIEKQAYVDALLREVLGRVAGELLGEFVGCEWGTGA